MEKSSTIMINRFFTLSSKSLRSCIRYRSMHLCAGLCFMSCLYRITGRLPLIKCQRSSQSLWQTKSTPPKCTHAFKNATQMVFPSIQDHWLRNIILICKGPIWTPCLHDCLPVLPVDTIFSLLQYLTTFQSAYLLKERERMSAGWAEMGRESQTGSITVSAELDLMIVAWTKIESHSQKTEPSRCPILEWSRVCTL